MRVHQTNMPQNPARIIKSLHEPKQPQVPFKIHPPLLTVMLWNHISLFFWMSCFLGTHLSEISRWKRGFLSTMARDIWSTTDLICSNDDGPARQPSDSQKSFVWMTPIWTVAQSAVAVCLILQLNAAVEEAGKGREGKKFTLLIRSGYWTGR